MPCITVAFQTESELRFGAEYVKLERMCVDLALENMAIKDVSEPKL